MSKTKIAVVGVGRWGTNHLKTYLTMNNVDVVAICDSSSSSLETVKNNLKLDIPMFNSSYEMYDKVDIDAVSICTPVRHHRNEAIIALGRNKHILVEKPFTVLIEEAEELINNRIKNKVLTVGFIERFNPTIVGIKKLLNNNVIGEVISASFQRFSPRPPNFQSLNIVEDVSVHDIDLVRYIFGDIKKVTGTVYDDYVYATLFVDYMIARIETSWKVGFEKERIINIIGTEGILKADLINQVILVNNREIYNFHNEKLPLTIELQHFIDCANYESNQKVTAEDGLEAVKICRLLSTNSIFRKL